MIYLYLASLPLPSSLRPRRICDLDDCGRVHEARGLCNRHYTRLRLTGSTDHPRETRRRANV